MDTAKKPSVLFVYYTYTQQTLKVVVTMAGVPRKSDGNNQRDRVDLYDARNQSWVWRQTRGRITGRRSGRTRHFNSNHHVISPWISHAEQSTRARRRHLGLLPLRGSTNGVGGNWSPPHKDRPKARVEHDRHRRRQQEQYPLISEATLRGRSRSGAPAAVYSTWSFAFASSRVCHCMLSGESAPPCFSACMWSIR